MIRVRIILHGARADAPILREVVELLRRSDQLQVEVRPTWEAGDALDLSSEAGRAGYDMVVAAGGDGTIHEVVNGVADLETRPAVGVIPLGTANDFATAMGLDPTDAAQIARVLHAGDHVPIDLVRADGRVFVNVATGGFGVSEQDAVPENLKAVFGGLAYLLSGVATLGAADDQTCSIVGEDFSWSGSFYGFAVANARCAGGGHLVSPDAYIDDGAFDVVVLPGTESVFQAISIASDFKIQAAEEHVKRWRTNRVTISSDDPLSLNLDGESHEFDGSVEFELLPKHLDLCVPAGSPLVSGGSQSGRRPRKDTPPR